MIRITSSKAFLLALFRFPFFSWFQWVHKTKTTFRLWNLHEDLSFFIGKKLTYSYLRIKTHNINLIDYGLVIELVEIKVIFSL